MGFHIGRVYFVARLHLERDYSNSYLSSRDDFRPQV